MKVFTLLILCFILYVGTAFAENPPTDTLKNDNDNNTATKSNYKSSPRLNYHSNKKEDGSGLEKLKPMLNQVIGNDQKNSTDSGGMPNGGTYSF